MRASLATRETVLHIGATTAMLNRLWVDIGLDLEYHSFTSI